MWALGVLSYVLLSGLSPFAGENDVDTLKNVKNCDWDFDEDSFRGISDEGKDFIRRLLLKNPEKRMTAHECLAHAWLQGDHSDRQAIISTERHKRIRDKIRAKYDNFNNYLLPFGRLSEYSSLRKLMIEKYKIFETNFDRRQAAPRFVIKPQNQFCYEGQSVKFTCRVIGYATPTLTWSHNNTELRQSVKYMKRYLGDDYSFVINRTKLSDRGEYIIKAENHYGSREEVVFLNVQPLKKEEEKYVEREDLWSKPRKPIELPVWEDVSLKGSAPKFTFGLRPRVMQSKDTCKLLCCLAGRPVPNVKWYKDQRELSKYEYNMTNSDGVVTVEIVDCKPEDTGRYRCVASNEHGNDETECVVIVEGDYGGSAEKTLLAHNLLYSGDRRFIQQPIAAPPVSKVTTNKSSYSYSTKDIQHSDSDNYRYNSVSITKDSHSSNITRDSSRNEIQLPSSPSRSRNATRELILPEASNKMTPPSFSKPLNDMEVSEGQKLELECAVSGDPEPKVTWLKDGSVVSSSEVLEVKYKNGVAKLIINEVLSEDAGTYVCQAKNTAGKVETKCTLKVNKNKSKSAKVDAEFWPKIVQHIESRYVNDGEPVVLSCTIECGDNNKGGDNASFDVVWLHNNKEIKPSKDFQYARDGNVYKLQIAEIFPEDSGTYTCEAFNNVGECFSTCTVNVLVPEETYVLPYFVDLPKSATVLENGSAEFRVTLKEETLTLEWLKDGKPIDNTSSRYQLEKPSAKAYNLTISNCLLTDVGQYQARAVNSKGEAYAAFSLNVFNK